MDLAGFGSDPSRHRHRTPEGLPVVSGTRALVVDPLSPVSGRWGHRDRTYSVDT